MDRDTALAKLEELRPRLAAEGISTQATVRPPRGVVDSRATFGLGLTRGPSSSDYRIAVRVQDEALVGSARVQAVVDAVHGEAEIEYVGVAQPFSTPNPSSPTERVRPLQPGVSISTETNVSAGTLGCFVADQDSTYVLSNCHVLADYGSGGPGLGMLQPGRLDGGNVPGDIAGRLVRAVPVDPAVANIADCAVAGVDPGDVDTTIPGLGRPGAAPTSVDIGESLAKRGRTTGVTNGEVLSTNLNLKFGWPSSLVEFVNLMEIVAPTGAPDFAAPGDSGALLLRADDLAPVALLVGGLVAGGQTRVYATPLATVLRELNVNMV